MWAKIKKKICILGSYLDLGNVFNTPCVIKKLKKHNVNLTLILNYEKNLKKTWLESSGDKKSSFCHNPFCYRII